MEIDMPEWFDTWVGAPINWAMSADLIGIENIWLVVAGLLVLIVLISLIHRRRVRRNQERRRQREISDRADAENQEMYTNRFIVPGDEV